jgi:hypothetical protein
MKAWTWSMRACGTPSRPGEDTPLLALNRCFAACELFDVPNSPHFGGPACSSEDVKAGQ